MIAKKISRGQATRAAGLIGYMVAARGGLCPESWRRTSEYVLDSKGETGRGEKVESWRVSNCHSDDPGLAATEIEVTEALNKRAQSDKTYHLVYSFPEGARPPLAVLHRVEDELCASIGLAAHQRISAVHVDTSHLHVHVAINKVHPISLKMIDPFQDKPSLMEACERLGAFEAGPLVEDKMREAGPLQRSASSCELWSAYQAERRRARGERERGLVRIRAGWGEENRRISRQSVAARLVRGAVGSGSSRRVLGAAQRWQARRARRDNAEEEASAARKELVERTRVLVWREWLAQRGQGGDGVALSALREGRAGRVVGNMLWSDRGGVAPILQQLGLRVGKDGSATYRTADGGVVVDGAGGIRVQRHTRHSAEVALSLAAERYSSERLTVRGRRGFAVRWSGWRR